jgi:hypothetical protein
MFIQKPGKSDYTVVKAYHPISLSFLFSMMEKLVGRHIRDNILKDHSLHWNQLTYKICQSAGTAFQSMVKHIGNAAKHKEITEAAFFDMWQQWQILTGNNSKSCWRAQSSQHHSHVDLLSLLGGRNIISSGENHEKAHNNKVSAWRCPVTSAVDPGCWWTAPWIWWGWLLICSMIRQWCGHLNK